MPERKLYRPRDAAAESAVGTMIIQASRIDATLDDLTQNATDRLRPYMIDEDGDPFDPSLRIVVVKETQFTKFIVVPHKSDFKRPNNDDSAPGDAIGAEPAYGNFGRFIGRYIMRKCR
jgi:hypothetical protein